LRRYDAYFLRQSPVNLPECGFLPQDPPMPRLRDVVTTPNPPRLLLVGINPGLRSWALGHHFAGNGNPFWRLIFSAGLVPEPVPFTEADRLATFGIALTNLCPRATRTAGELGPSDLARGRRVLARKISRWRPAVVAFVGVSLYQIFFELPRSGGPGEKPERIAGARVFVVPNPSGLNASFPGFEDKLVWFKALRAFVDREAPRPADRANARRPARRP
jgi:TDG/mug DNA glycosylase family protein